MISFIICEDNIEVNSLINEIIQKLMSSNSLNYQTFSFYKYNNDLRKVINDNTSQKIYIIDIELKNTSGIEIAREIRKEDWESIIIFSTAHSELFPQIIKDRLMIFDFISKFDNYNKNLLEALKQAIIIYTQDKFLTFTIRKKVYNERLRDILYLMYVKEIRKTLVVTLNEKLEVSKSLSLLSKNLPNYFIKINNHCIINKENIKKIKNNGDIVFRNGSIISEDVKNKELVV